jgi:thiol-disulfide isomerase/thioredoxin
MKKLIFIVLLVSAIQIGFALEVGEEAPTFVNPKLDGVFVFSKNLIGNGWLLVDFFATDCVPCKEELPQLEIIQEQFAEDGLVGIVFATDAQGNSVVRPFFEERPTNMMVLIDRFKVAAQKYGVETIPSVFLVNPEGKIAFMQVGYAHEAIVKMTEILTDAYSGEQES